MYAKIASSPTALLIHTSYKLIFIALFFCMYKIAMSPRLVLKNVCMEELISLAQIVD